MNDVWQMSSESRKDYKNLIRVKSSQEINELFSKCLKDKNNENHIENHIVIKFSLRYFDFVIIIFP